MHGRSGHAIACSPRHPRLRPSGSCGLPGSIVARGANPIFWFNGQSLGLHPRVGIEVDSPQPPDGASRGGRGLVTDSPAPSIQMCVRLSIFLRGDPPNKTKILLPVEAIYFDKHGKESVRQNWQFRRPFPLIGLTSIPDPIR